MVPTPGEPSAIASATATRLGSYEILRHLARGGMAELFLARAVGPQGFEKLVVLKKILPSFAANPRFVQLFLDEAKLGASLDHPNIAQVHDMGMVDGSYFFTMEYLHGQDVRSMLRRAVHTGAMTPIDHAVHVIRNVASALHYAHERRGTDGKLRDIVHRDVSPSNIIVSYDGAVKLLDFGVAKATNSSVKTRTGTLKGKVAYMSPEQARGAAIDRRSDIFSLGIVLWEMVATRRLFRAPNDLATIQQIINDPPPSLVELRPDCPPELERIAHKALAKSMADRYQTAQDLQLDLEELARESKLKQSTVALTAYMSALFRDEIDAWKSAQSKGVTFTDHVVSAVDDPPDSGELTTPVSDSMLEFGKPPEDLDDPDAEADDGSFGPPEASVSGSIDPDPRPEIHEDITHQSAPPAADEEATATRTAKLPTAPFLPGVTPRASEPAIAKPRPPAPVPPLAPTPIPKGGFEVAASTGSGPSIVTAGAVKHAAPIDFVGAPASAWAQAEVTDQLGRPKKKTSKLPLVIASMVVLVGGVVLAVKLTGKPADPGPSPATTPVNEAKPDDVPAAKPADDPAAKTDPKPEPKPDPAPIAKPEPKPIAKPEPKAIAKPETKPAAKPEPKPIAKPEPKTIAKPATKPETKPTTKPETKPVTKPADPKPKPPPPKKPPKPFDPDAPLPPS